MIFQMHEKHGRHIAYSPQEAESNRKNGWIDVSREVFYEKTLPGEGVPAVEARNVLTTSQEAPKDNIALPKKRGRKPKVRVE